LHYNISMDLLNSNPPAQNQVSRRERAISILFYPFYALYKNAHSNANFLKKLLFFLFIMLVLYPVWLIEMAAFGFLIWFSLQFTSVVYVAVPVEGASMLPTLPTHGYVNFKRFLPIEKLQPQIKRGDLVVFENTKTDSELIKEGKNVTGFVKRVIGLAGDVVKIRDGFVYINGQMAKEGYTLKPRSTFGGQTISDCQEVTIPKNQLLVLGDNRKISLDSRQIGLISLKDISYYRPYSDQLEFVQKWRNSSTDEQAANSSIFDITAYLSFLNAKREEAGLSLLKHQTKLDQSAKLRAEVMLKYDDLSFEATRSAYPMEQAMKDSGYSNIVYGEFPMLGYYDTRELYEAFIERKNSRDFLLNKDYQEIGVSTFVGELRGCPVQIVVQHLAGYIPPSYTKETIKSWKELVTRLKEVQPSWQILKDYEDFYKRHRHDVDKLNEIINTRLTMAQAVVARMEANEWLTEEEKKYMDEDRDLYNQQTALAQKLNEAINER